VFSVLSCPWSQISGLFEKSVQEQLSIKLSNSTLEVIMFLSRSEYDRGVNTFSPEGRLFQVRKNDKLLT
jgi:hypothetical protein